MPPPQRGACMLVWVHRANRKQVNISNAISCNKCLCNYRLIQVPFSGSVEGVLALWNLHLAPIFAQIQTKYIFLLCV